jgi:TolB-like protein/DNA-binding winged helix-turn-helix (wHTH) protein
MTDPIKKENAKTVLPPAQRFGRFVVLPAQRQVLVDGQPAALGARAFDLLLMLMEHHQRVVSKDELMASVWPGLVVEDNNLTVQISALRKVFGPDAIATVPGRGYQFVQLGVVMKYPTASTVPDAALNPASSLPTSSDAVSARASGSTPVWHAPERRKAVPLPGDNLALPEKPSIAVLPFANFSDDTDLAHFTDGLTEDITTELARFRSLFVISRTSAFTFKNRAVDVRTVARELGVRYVLEGSVRHANNRIRVTAQLVDALDGKHLWAEKYDRVLADIFDVQEEVTRAIVGAIAPQIDHVEGNWARKSHPENLAAYGLALHAWSIANSDMLEPDSAERPVAYALARQAVQADLNAALAWRAIALIQWAQVYFNCAPDKEEAIAEGLDAASRAIALDATDHIAMNLKGMLLGLDGKEAAGLSALRSAYEINRNHVLGLGFLGVYEALAGNSSIGVGYALEAFRLSPRDPNRHYLLICLSFAYFASQQDAQALEIAEMAMRELPDRPVPYLLLALAHVGLGQVALAKEAFAKLQALAPKMVEARLAGQWLSTNPVYHLRALTFLRVAAGLEPAARAADLR